MSKQNKAMHKETVLKFSLYDNNGIIYDIIQYISICYKYL